ncbi:hypothetical protein RintRC_2561 [Richelia intracellularis]|nr:hypothetical protein RintRC_2561 [Richelia intracellularis]
MTGKSVAISSTYMQILKLLNMLNTGEVVDLARILNLP